MEAEDEGLLLTGEFGSIAPDGDAQDQTIALADDLDGLFSALPTRLRFRHERQPAVVVAEPPVRHPRRTHLRALALWNQFVDELPPGLMRVIQLEAGGEGNIDAQTPGHRFVGPQRQGDLHHPVELDPAEAGPVDRPGSAAAAPFEAVLALQSEVRLARLQDDWRAGSRSQRDGNRRCEDLLARRADGCREQTCHLDRPTPAGDRGSSTAATARKEAARRPARRRCGPASRARPDRTGPSPSPMRPGPSGSTDRHIVRPTVEVSAELSSRGSVSMLI